MSLSIRSVQSDESKEIECLFDKLVSQPKISFPAPHQRISAPNTHGVYIIRDTEGGVLYVGRTQRGKNGLRQRLGNHINKQSSYSEMYLATQGSALREGRTFQYLEVDDARRRALLEHFAVGWLTPQYLGLGARKTET